jgi:hypothetical protein
VIVTGAGSDKELAGAIAVSVPRLERMFKHKGAETLTLEDPTADTVLSEITKQFLSATKKWANVAIFYVGHANEDGEWALPGRPLSVSEILTSWSNLRSTSSSLAIVSDCCFAGKQIKFVSDSKRADVCLMVSCASDEV